MMYVAMRRLSLSIRARVSQSGLDRHWSVCHSARPGARPPVACPRATSTPGRPGRPTPTGLDPRFTPISYCSTPPTPTFPPPREPTHRPPGHASPKPPLPIHSSKSAKSAYCEANGETAKPLPIETSAKQCRYETNETAAVSSGVTKPPKPLADTCDPDTTAQIWQLSKLGR